MLMRFFPCICLLSVYRQGFGPESSCNKEIQLFLCLKTFRCWARVVARVHATIVYSPRGLVRQQCRDASRTHKRSKTEQQVLILIRLCLWVQRMKSFLSKSMPPCSLEIVIRCILTGSLNSWSDPELKCSNLIDLKIVFHLTCCTM